MDSELERVCRRYEIAVGNFGRSCITLRANEKCFQAWYASCVIQEFGLSRVYREVHLSKGSLFAVIPPHELWQSLERGNELFPDLVVSWEPDVDVRHSSSRAVDLRNADAMLARMAIVSELKVTGSTGLATSRGQLRQDLAKLAVFTAAHSRTTGGRGIVSYMVVLDNRPGDGRAGVAYNVERMSELLRNAAESWPADVSMPVVLLISNDKNGVRVHRLCETARGSRCATRAGMWTDVAAAFESVQDKWRVAANSERELKLHSPAPGITYLWEFDKEGRLWADLSIQFEDPAANKRYLQRLKAAEPSLKAIHPSFSAEVGAKNSVVLGFGVPTMNGEPSIDEATNLMLQLLEVTWPLVHDAGV